MKHFTILLILAFLVVGPFTTGLYSQETEPEKEEKSDKQKEIEKRNAELEKAIKEKKTKGTTGKTDTNQREPRGMEKNVPESKSQLKSKAALRAEDLKAKLDKIKAAAKAAKNNPASVNKNRAKKARPTVDPKKTEKYWRNRKAKIEKNHQKAKQKLDEIQEEAKALEIRMLRLEGPDYNNAINKLKELLISIQNYKRGVATLNQQLENLADEARKAGVPPGWLR